MRKTLTQIAKEDRARTEKWRAARKSRGVPEARQVDRTMLLAFAYCFNWKGRHVINEGAFAIMAKLAVQLLVRRGSDRAEAVAAVQKRMGDLVKSTEIRDMLRAADFEARHPTPARSVTP